jgi:hypothetical protein
MIAFFQTNSTAILGALFFLSEALALVPGIKANSVFQMVFGWLQSEQPKA